jgi:hypothetical protein
MARILRLVPQPDARRLSATEIAARILRLSAEAYMALLTVLLVIIAGSLVLTIALYLIGV